MAVENWVSQKETDQVTEVPHAAATQVVSAATLMGVSGPQPGVAAVTALPSVQVLPSGVLHVVAAHGGAGASTLAALMAQRVAAAGWAPQEVGCAWPYAPGAVLPVVVTCRTHRRGLQAAQAVAAQWASGQMPGVHLVGLVAVADAPGKLPRELRDLLHVVGGGVPATWRLPWVEGWRTSPPVLKESPRAVRLVVDDLATQLNH